MTKNHVEKIKDVKKEIAKTNARKSTFCVMRQK